MSESYDEFQAKLYPEAAARKEYIVCAAIHMLDGKVYEHQPKNIESGLVMCGLRHHNAITNLVQLIGRDNVLKYKEVQGFLTSKDRFVSREEAATIAFSTGQISKPHTGLFSEDLY